MRSQFVLLESLYTHGIGTGQIAACLGCGRSLIIGARHGKPLSARQVERLEALLAEVKPKPCLYDLGRFVEGARPRFGR